MSDESIRPIKFELLYERKSHRALAGDLVTIINRYFKEAAICEVLEECISAIITNQATSSFNKRAEWGKFWLERADRVRHERGAFFVKFTPSPDEYEKGYGNKEYNVAEGRFLSKQISLGIENVHVPDYVGDVVRVFLRQFFIETCGFTEVERFKD